MAYDGFRAQLFDLDNDPQELNDLGPDPAYAAEREQHAGHLFDWLAGMPRRIPDYNLQFADFNMVSSIGAFMFGATQIFFLFIVIKCIRGGPPAPAKPWDGAEGLEWSIPSPAPYHTFTTPPEVK